MKGLLAIVALMMTAACGGGSAAATSPSPLSAAFSESLSQKVQAAHFEVFGGTTPDATLIAAADRLEADYARILGNLNVARDPTVVVRLWQGYLS